MSIVSSHSLFIIVVCLFALFTRTKLQETSNQDVISVAWTGIISSNSKPAIFELAADVSFNSGDHANVRPNDLLFERNGRLHAIESDFVNNRIFFQNKRTNFLGILDLATNRTKKYFEGMMKSVENLAFDWISGNLYWTDHNYKMIMVVDPTLTYYSSIYRSNNKPSAIAVHPNERILYFSIRSPSDASSSIQKSDMNGEDNQQLVELGLNEVTTSIAIDMSNNRIYWTSNTVRQSRTVSCDLDGNNVVEHFRSDEAYFSGVAAFKGIIYVTDNHAYQDSDRRRYFKMHRQQTGETNFENATLSDRPIRITFLNKPGNVTFASGLSPHGGCRDNGLPACQQICLARRNRRRICACGMGYTKSGDTNCITNLALDNFLLVLDASQKRVFQLSLSSTYTSSYHILPIPSEFDQTVVTMAMNSRTKTLYWSDKSTSTIHKFRLGADQATLVRQGMHASAIAVEPITGNVYFADEDTGYMHMMNENGTFLKTLLDPDYSSDDISIVVSMQIDSKNGYIYWVEFSTTYRLKKRNIKRMKLTGGKHELVISGIFQCNSIVIDYERQTLLYAEAGNVVNEIPLSSLVTVNGKKPVPMKKHEISGLRRSNYIQNLKVDGNKFYITQKNKKFVWVFEPESESSPDQFGHAQFYQPKMLEMFKSQTFEEHLAPLGNPCNNTLCTQLCIVTSSNESTCACQDGRRLVGYNCLETSGEHIDQPPNYGNSCPADREVTIQTCVKTVPLQIQFPQWTDDRTASRNLIIRNPTIRRSYPAGVHRFLFTATDEAGHIGHCTYTITVTVSTCPFNFPFRYEDLALSPPRCDNDDYVFTITCANTSTSFYYDGRRTKEVRNKCLNGEWLVSDLDLLECSQTPLPPTTTTRPPATTTRPSTTSNKITPPKSTTTSSDFSTATNNEVLAGPNALSDEKGGLSLASSIVIGIICVVIIVSLIVVAAFLARRKGFLTAISPRRIRLFWSTTDEDGILTNSFDAQSLQSIS